MENHNGKKKFGVISLNTRGGGIEQVIALGGALAVASLVAAFSFKKKSNKNDNNNKDMETTNVAAQVLHQNSCCTGITDSESVSTQVKDSVSETLVHDAKQERNEMTGNIKNESNVIAILEMETFEISIVDKAMDVDAGQPTQQSSITTQEDGGGEEEYSQMRSSFSIEDDQIGQVVEEDYSPKESTMSTEEDENVSEVYEESSDGTWSSSPEPTKNMEVIWPVEMMDMNVSSNLESEMKYKEESIKGKIETYHHYVAKTTFDGKKNKKVVTDKIVVMDVRKQHSSRRHNWVWFGLVVLMLGLLANYLVQSNYLSSNFSFVFP